MSDEESELFVCSECERVFRSPRGLAVHKTKTHKNLPAKPIPPSLVNTLSEGGTFSEMMQRVITWADDNTDFGVTSEFFDTLEELRRRNILLFELSLYVKMKCWKAGTVKALDIEKIFYEKLTEDYLRKLPPTALMDLHKYICSRVDAIEKSVTEDLRSGDPAKAIKALARALHSYGEEHGPPDVRLSQLDIRLPEDSTERDQLTRMFRGAGVKDGKLVDRSDGPVSRTDSLG